MPVYTGGKGIRSKAQRAIESNLKENKHKGEISIKAAKRVRNATNWLLQSATWKPVWYKEECKTVWFKVNFITLTIPYHNNSQIDGKMVHKLLHTWLTYARKYFYLHNYVWKVERGDGGKLHVHLSTDTFIHWRDLRSSWNRLLMKNGLLDKYYNVYGNYDANSTDVHAVKKVDNLAAYLGAYMMKKANLGEDFKNRIWGCNRELGDKNKCSYLADVSELEEVSKPLMHIDINWKPVDSKPDSLGKCVRIGEIFFMNEDIWARVMYGKIKETYRRHIKTIRDRTPVIPEQYLIYDERESTLPTKPIIRTERLTETIPIVTIKPLTYIQPKIQFN